MNEVETCNADQVEIISTGQYTDACLAIGKANLPTILDAEQRVSEELDLAVKAQVRVRGYVARLRLVRGRRRRLQLEAQGRREQGNKRATFRL